MPEENEIEIPKWGGIEINDFNGLNLKGDLAVDCGLVQVMERFSDRFPVSDVDVIASDAGGNQFLIGFGKDYFGKVYCWDNEDWDDEAENCFPEVIEVAKTFNVLLKKITWM